MEQEKKGTSLRTDVERDFVDAHDNVMLGRPDEKREPKGGDRRTGRIMLDGRAEC